MLHKHIFPYDIDDSNKITLNYQDFLLSKLFFENLHENPAFLNCPDYPLNRKIGFVIPVFFEHYLS